jgi:hypothetical protein
LYRWYLQKRLMELEQRQMLSLGLRVLRVLLALARKPGDLKPLRVVAARSRTALEALGHGVHLLRGNLQRA